LRACIFITDLAKVASHGDALVSRASALAGVPAFDEVCFVGCRQSRPLDEGVTAYQPYVTADVYSRMRVANTLFRLVDAKAAPAVAARAGLSVCAPAIIEIILACDPDFVLLDVSWGGYLKVLLDADLPGRVCVSGHQTPASRPGAPFQPDSEASVSIVLPTHNGTRYIRRSIESCLAQSHARLELIVVDDGSTEDMGAIVSGFADRRIRYVRHPTNQGISAALNTGFALATGDYLTWTSDDNWYEPQAIGRLGAFLQKHPDIGFVYASSYIVDERQGLRIRRPLPPQELTRQNGVGACFLYTRQVYREVGEYNSDAFLVEDYDYWVRVSKRFRMQRVLSPLYYYRYHEKSLTSTHSVDEVARRFDLVKQQHGLA
jgi:hypothetical protein